VSIFLIDLSLNDTSANYLLIIGTTSVNLSLTFVSHV